MKPHLRYLWTVLRHKWFVFLAGRRVGVSIGRLLIHDLSKFSRAEWSPYVRRFEGGRAGKTDHEGDADEWHRAWLHHWHRNPHHWEHWLRFKHGSSVVPLVMPEHFAREMVADWMGAGRAYTGTWDPRSWYARNRNQIVLHDTTRLFVEQLMDFETA